LFFAHGEPAEAEMTNFEAQMEAKVRETGRCVLARASDGKLIYWRGGHCANRVNEEKT
jgi:hypothetical protein